MDHSGSLLRFGEKLPQAEILCSPRGVDALKRCEGLGRELAGKIKAS
jgi:flavorubredoxin